MDIGRSFSINAETPFMVIDLNQARKNIEKFQKIAEDSNKALRPHSKTHKIPFISRLQISEGASGICVQKVSEAEIMFEGGISQILISNEVVDQRKCYRIAKLAARGCSIIVAVDSVEGTENLSKMASCFDLSIPVVIDVDTGMNRCGIEPEKVLEFHSYCKNFENIKVVGLMVYDGHINDRNPLQRERMVASEGQIISGIFKSLKEKDRNVTMLTVGGTPTAELWSKVEEITEIQPGTYVFYDIHCLEMGLSTIDEISMGVVTQVMSMKEGERIVLDAGYKSVSIDQGIYPVPVNEDGVVGTVTAMSEEHTVIRNFGNNISFGSKILLLPYHSCTTTDLWDYSWIFEGTRSPILTKIEARGKRE